MERVELTEEQFEKLSGVINQVRMPNDGYIPSEMDVFDYIERHPERYYKYLLWFSEHRPQPKTEAEKKLMRDIIKVTNRTIDIV